MFNSDQSTGGSRRKGQHLLFTNHTKLSQKFHFTFHYIIQKDLTGNILNLTRNTSSELLSLYQSG